MDLSIDEAAVLLGKTARQVRYLVIQQRLPARKVGGRWVIDRATIRATIEPTSAGPQQPQQARKLDRFREAVDRALDLDASPRRARYSVVDMKAFQVGRPLLFSMVDELGPDHAATVAMRHALELIARGCHRFARDDKAHAYRAARDAAADALCAVLLSRPAPAAAIAGALEQDLMPAIAGLLKRMERPIREDRHRPPVDSPAAQP